MTAADLAQARHWANRPTARDANGVRVAELAIQDHRGKYLRMVIDEVERLQARVAELERLVPTTTG